MSQEISVTANLALANGNVKGSQSVSIKPNQTTAKKHDQTQDIGTTHEAIVVNADISTPGWAHFRNLDTTNYVEIGLLVSSTFQPFSKMKPGEPATFRIASGVTLYAKANTAACTITSFILAD